MLERRAACETLGRGPQEFALYEDVSTTENFLRYWGAAYGLRGTDRKRPVQKLLVATGLLGRGSKSR